MGGIGDFWGLPTRTITSDQSSKPAIQIAPVWGRGSLGGRCPFHSSLPKSLKINRSLPLSPSLPLFAFVWVSLFKHTHKHKHDSSRGAAIILPENSVNKRQPSPPFPQGRDPEPLSNSSSVFASFTREGAPIPDYAGLWSTYCRGLGMSLSPPLPPPWAGREAET